MSGSSPQQRAAFEQADASRVATENRFTRESFVDDFLRFSGRVIRELGGGGEPRPRHHTYSYWQGISKLVAVETAPESPQMSAAVAGHIYEVTKRRSLKSSKRTIIREVASASVLVGPTAADRGLGQNYFASSETILQVFAHPPTVFYQHGEQPIASIEAGTPEWEEMTEFVASLYAQEDELSYGEAKPTGWDVG